MMTPSPELVAAALALRDLLARERDVYSVSVHADDITIQGHGRLPAGPGVGTDRNGYDVLIDARGVLLVATGSPQALLGAAGTAHEVSP